MKIEEGSYALLKWIQSTYGFRKQPLSERQISHACQIIFEKVDCKSELEKFKKHLLFYPLLRRGLVEYAPHRSFVPSTEFGIYESIGTKLSVVIINPSVDTSEKLRSCLDFKTDALGSIYANLSQRQFQEFKKELPIQFQLNTGLQKLKKVPVFIDYLTSLEPEYSQQSEFYYWQPSKKFKVTCLNKPGYYRSTERSYGRHFFFDGKTLFRLPSENKNPDAPYIAKSVHLTLQGRSSFNEFGNCFITNAFETPILLERLIRLIDFDFDYFVNMDNPFQATLPISRPVQLQLKRILKINRD